VLFDRADEGYRRRGVVALSPDESLLAAVVQRDVIVWDAASLTVLWRGHAVQARSSDPEVAPTEHTDVAFLPSGRTLVIADDAGALRAHDARSGRLQASLGSAPRVPERLVFKGATLLARSPDRLTEWSLDDATVLQSRPAAEADPPIERYGATTPDGKYRFKRKPLLNPQRRSELEVIEIASGRVLHKLVIGVAADPYREGADVLAISSDSKRLAFAFNSTVATAPIPGTVDDSWSVNAVVGSLAFLDDARVVVGGRDGTLRIIDTTMRKEIAVVESNGGAISAIAVDPTGKRLATVSGDGGVRLWELPDLRLVASLGEFEDDEWISFTPGGAYSGTAEVSDRVAWVYREPVEALRFEQFESRYARPEVVRARLRGGKDDVAQLDHRPPRVVSGTAPPAAERTRARVHVESGTRVDKVRAFADGRPVAEARVCAASADVELDVPLVAGLNRIAVVAYDERGVASAPRILDVTSARAARPELWLVGVGVSAYPRLGPEYQLALADDDARGVVAALAAQAGPGKPYAAAHTSLLVDENATPEAVDRSLAELARMRAEDLAVVFLAGHGVKPAPDAPMVFLTSKATATREGIASAGVGWSAIGARLAAARGRVLVILDACHSGDVSRERIVQNGAMADALVRDQRAGAFVFAAAKGRQVSYEPSGIRALQLETKLKARVTTPSAHGYFTAALLASLAAPDTDRNGNGFIELSELVDEVTERVADATRGAQTPWVARRELVGDVVLVPAPRP
jgi:hypothetical protein